MSRGLANATKPSLDGSLRFPRQHRHPKHSSTVCEAKSGRESQDVGRVVGRARAPFMSLDSLATAGRDKICEKRGEGERGRGRIVLTWASSCSVLGTLGTAIRVWGSVP